MRKEFLSGILSIIKTLPWEKKKKRKKRKRKQKPGKHWEDWRKRGC